MRRVVTGRLSRLAARGMLWLAVRSVLRPLARRLWPLLIVLPALIGQALVLWYGLRHERFGSILRTELLAGALFAVAVFGLWRYRGPAARQLVLAGAVLLQLAALGAGPSSSDDVYRYVWDAKAQLAGVDPYRYPPAAHELARLRSTALFYREKPGCPWQLPDGRCSRVNRPEVRTIYPPVAEGAFALARLGSLGRSDGPFPLQVFGALGALAVTLLLLGRARTRGDPAWRPALWAWCPVTAVELANNGHIDWLAALFTAAALMTYRARRPALAGGLLGAAVATKLYPALVLPALLRRHPVRVVGAAVGVVLVSYLPHVLAVGTRVVGYLPGYLKEEDYTSGGRFLLLARVLPHGLLTPAAVLLLLAVAAWAARWADPDRPEQAAVVLVGTGLLVATPSYSWYAAELLVLVAMTGWLEWLPLVLAPTIANLGAPSFGDGVGFRTACYAVALAVVLIGSLIRFRLRCRSRSGRGRIRLAPTGRAP
ncbi:MAG: glycosyltransferase 87 family protein [Jatrophihabitantaceae bacterium]